MTNRRRGRARPPRSFANVPSGAPLVWQAAWLCQHAGRPDQSGRKRADALAVLALSTSIYHTALSDGVRQAVHAGASVQDIAIALGMTTDDVRNRIRMLRKHDRELSKRGRGALSMGVISPEGAG